MSNKGKHQIVESNTFTHAFSTILEQIYHKMIKEEHQARVSSWIALQSQISYLPSLSHTCFFFK